MMGTENLYLGVGAEGNENGARAAELAAALQLPLVDLNGPLTAYRFILVQTTDHLELRPTDNRNTPFTIDFLSNQLQYRRQHSNRKNEAIARAVGIKGSTPLRILDATAGLGRDSFILASLGCEMTLIERSPVIAALLRDGLARAQSRLTLPMSLLETDAITFMHNLDPSAAFDVVYLDPMFPPRIKSAAVKKDMQILHALLGNEPDDEVALLEAALTVAKKRVVVKRPQWAPLIGGVAPTLEIRTKSYYFAVYLR